MSIMSFAPMCWIYAVLVVSGRLGNKLFAISSKMLNVFFRMDALHFYQMVTIPFLNLKAIFVRILHHLLIFSMEIILLKL